MTVQRLTIAEGADAPRMAERTTLRLGGPVLAEVRLGDMRDVDSLPEIASRLGGRLAAIGAGSNILAGDAALPVVLVRDAANTSLAMLAEDATSATLHVGCGGKLPTLLSRLASRGLSGLEGLCGIPGCVGGAVAMNAGSFGQSIGDAVVSLDVAVPGKGIVTVPREDITFAYRHMRIPALRGWHMLAGVTLRLAKTREDLVAAAMRATMEKKKASQPVTSASAGCVFKNPDPEHPAGRLLEEAGFKGRRVGAMAFSTMHANFMVNEGGGRAAEALELIALAKEAVAARYGIALETEVRLWV